jgi:hypothetical protein
MEPESLPTRCHPAGVLRCATRSVPIAPGMGHTIMDTTTLLIILLLVLLLGGGFYGRGRWY